MDVAIQLTLEFPDPDNTDIVHSLVVGNLNGHLKQQFPACFSHSYGKSPIDLLWNGGTLQYPKPHIGPPPVLIPAAGQDATRWLKNELSDKRQADDFAAFQEGYAKLLLKDRDKIQQSVDGHIKDADANITKIRAALLFLVKYGVGSDDSALTVLDQWLSDPLHLPSSGRYIRAMLQLGASAKDLNAYSQKMVDEGMAYVNSLSQVQNLKGGPMLIKQ